LGIVSASVFAVLFGLSGRYGYHRDELYYLAAGRHPAWGYDDQPPVVVMLARLADEVAGGSLFALRLPSALGVAAIALLTGLIAAELGGRVRAQVLSALAMAVAPVLGVAGHLLSTTVLDILWWTLLAYLVVRFIRVRSNAALWLPGPVIGVGLLTKTLIAVFVAALLAGLLIAGPRDVFKRPALWGAAVIALLMWAPNLWWQAGHGWPQLEMTAVIRADADWGGQPFVLPTQLILMGPVLAPLWIAGLWRLLRSQGLRPYRAFGIAWLVVLVVVIATGGRNYYLAGAYPVLIAAGTITALAWLRRKFLLTAAVAFTAAGTALMSLPLYPVGSFADTPVPAINYDAGETIGWPQLVQKVADVYNGLSEKERATAVILTANYGQAGAIARYGPALGLPQPYSGHLGFWRWGPPPAGATGPVIIVSETRPARVCDAAEIVARHDNGYRVDNEEQGVTLWKCDRAKGPWQELWPSLRHL
jgi:4-amino-4-deoxy-L-arabinose transferase-like glycosyltransferase